MDEEGMSPSLIAVSSFLFYSSFFMRETAINVENIDLFMSGVFKTTSRASNSLFLVFESRTVVVLLTAHQ